MSIFLKKIWSFSFGKTLNGMTFAEREITRVVYAKYLLFPSRACIKFMQAPVFCLY